MNYADWFLLGLAAVTAAMLLFPYSLFLRSRKTFLPVLFFNVTVLTTLIGRNKEQLLSLCDGLVSCEFYMLTKELVEVIVGATLIFIPVFATYCLFRDYFYLSSSKRAIDSIAIWEPNVGRVFYLLVLFIWLILMSLFLLLLIAREGVGLFCSV